MYTYKITYYDGTNELIKAAAFRDIDNTWIEFVDGPKNQLLRLRADKVLRIEIQHG